jgi:4-diphosphocytidyl-2-C-methyl-D-erythritol kinase
VTLHAGASAPRAVDAFAKVNLHLHVTGRRADGYHTLDSLVVFAEAADRITVAPDATLSLALAGPFADGLAGEAGNLVLRAAHALAAAHGIAPAARITLDKHLPVASGIGGGSADAAATLRALAALWDVAVPEAVALSLGADVPVCLAGRACVMRGIGEELHPAPALPPCGLLLVNPGVALSTAEVFAARTGAFSAEAALPAFWTDAMAMGRDLARLGNDLEAPAIRLRPAIAGVLAALRGTDALLARMSGSGATCFGLYPDAPSARAAARTLPETWWRHAGQIGGSGHGTAGHDAGP